MPRPTSWQARVKALNALYSPAAPINSEKFFYGRKVQLNRIHETVGERGLHVAIYGERGVGKTSLANIVEQQYLGAVTSKVTCNTESTLAGLWKTTFKRIPVSFHAKTPIGFNPTEKEESCVQQIGSIADLLDPNQRIDVDDITSYFDYIRASELDFLLIFDEFDQIGDRAVVKAFANIIKYLSDTIPNVTIMTVGIGRSITDLIGEHQSVERCIRQVPLERMSDIELAEIVTTATKQLGMSMEKAVQEKIVSYSSGFPHYTHLLGKYTTLQALNAQRPNITDKDFTKAMIHALENVNESIRHAYETAVLSSKEDALFQDVLYACAMTPADEHGTFRATDLEHFFHNTLKTEKPVQAFQYHLGRLCSKERGAVLEKVAVGRTRARYRFVNPLFRAYLRLRFHQSRESH